VIVQDTTVVPAMTEMVINTIVQYNTLNDNDTDDSDAWSTEATEPAIGLRVSRALVPKRSTDVPVRVMNVTTEPLELKQGKVMSLLQTVTVATTGALPAPSTSSANLQVLRQLADAVDDEVPDEARAKLMRLLVEYSGVFSFDETDLGRTSVIKHSIDTEGARPVRQPLRRQPPAHQEAIRDHVSTMLKQGVIEPAQSPWASNLVLVRKKDGTLRCCVDYRQLNASTTKDAYPLPRTDACLDALSGAAWFTTLDMRSSYHQVEVEEKDRDKTTFICREGAFHFVTTPFGLCNAGATFQRLMDIVMSGLNFEACLVYLDDVIIFSSTVDQHLDRLRQVLDRLGRAGHRLKPS